MVCGRHRTKTTVNLPGLGGLIGVQKKTRNGIPINVFQGIPYAKPPVGTLRFALPQPLDQPWQDNLDCTKTESNLFLQQKHQSKQPSVLFQDSKFLISGDEDCLYLNVYTPWLSQENEGDSSVKTNLPVLVWFHGGAFCIGSNEMSLYGPDFILDHDVILVGVNYRLGPLGFLSLGCDEAPGNQGMHDQVASLKWVRDYIHYFGGNKDNVTLLGESAGAMACFLHYVSPLSKGLFHKIITLSGSASTPFMHNDRKPEIYGKEYAKSFGLNIEDSPQNLVDQLRSENITAKQLVTNSTIFKDWDNTFPMPWKPVVDNYASVPFLPLSFEEMIKAGNFDKTVPILAGTMGEEGLILSAPFHKSSKRWNMLFRQWKKWAPQLFLNRETDLITESDIIAVKKALGNYFPIEFGLCSSDPTDTDQSSLTRQTSTTEDDANLLPMSPLPNQPPLEENKQLIPPWTDDNLKKLEEILSTAWFHAPLSNDLSKLVDLGVNAYSFKFSYQGSFSMVDLFRLSKIKVGLNFLGRYLGINLYRKKLGTCHADDLLYIFPFSKFGMPKTLIEPKDHEVSSKLTLYVTNFAKFGNPTPDKEDSNVTSSFTWPKFDSGDNRVVTFEKNGSIVTGNDKDEQRNMFWNQLFNDISFQTSNKNIEHLHNKIAEYR